MSDYPANNLAYDTTDFFNKLKLNLYPSILILLDAIYSIERQDHEKITRFEENHAGNPVLAPKMTPNSSIGFVVILS